MSSIQFPTYDKIGGGRSISLTETWGCVGQEGPLPLFFHGPQGKKAQPSRSLTKQRLEERSGQKLLDHGDAKRSCVAHGSGFRALFVQRHLRVAGVGDLRGQGRGGSVLCTGGRKGGTWSWQRRALAKRSTS